MNLTQKIESYLFYTGEPVTIKKLAQLFNVSSGETMDAVRMLDENLAGHGIMVIHNQDTVQLVTHPESSEMIQEMKKQELSDPLSKSALETLAIILYKDGAMKPEIDFIRGVNSGFMLRNLLVRGLIEKIENPDDKRITKYRVTNDTFRLLGIARIDDLPDFALFDEEFSKRESLAVETTDTIFTQTN
jgi:segregation and condensation protein B